MWFTSDLHFGHANIVKYTNRPFVDVEAMDAWLVDAWNDTVAPDDEVWVLGDVALGDRDRSLRHVARLHGRLRLVAGNHDKVFRPDDKPRADWEQRYRQAGFVDIAHGVVDVDLGLGSRVLVCHFPYTGDSRVEDRYAGHRPFDCGEFLLHGHVHGRWRRRDRMVDVGVDAWAGRPVHADTLADLLRDDVTDVGPLEWTSDRFLAARS
jgi:calcineurin-like phosphoesterase family protein